ncbi:MAG: type II toxin-antitoxin system RelE/ParE family toxin [Gammaproteobacteria bacterium]|nr:type II toxin-antitoxin system RelE/ParE family toxin [Gammaproteobacteria bacterium]
MEILKFVDTRDESPFARRFDRLDEHAAAKVATALLRLEQGNQTNVKGAGGGVLEYRIDFGPGYRIYFGRDGDERIVLVGGGTKTRQQLDIEKSRDR